MTGMVEESKDICIEFNPGKTAVSSPIVSADRTSLIYDETVPRPLFPCRMGCPLTFASC